MMPAIAHKALVSAAAMHSLSVINGEIAFEKSPFFGEYSSRQSPKGVITTRPDPLPQ
jgi:hypothetical protein